MSGTYSSINYVLANNPKSINKLSPIFNNTSTEFTLDVLVFHELISTFQGVKHFQFSELK